MTVLLDQAMERLRALSPERQDELAFVLLQLAEDDGSMYQLTAEEEASLAQSIAKADRGEFATDE